MPDGVEIAEDDEKTGAIVSFPFDAEFSGRFRESFPKARWSERHRAWRLPGRTAVHRAARWLAQELPGSFARADERGRDGLAFDPIISPYLSVADDLVVRTPYSRTVIEELRAVPWARWDGEDRAWHIPFRSVEELRRRWPAIETAAAHSEPTERRARREAARSEASYQFARADAAERRRRRYPVPAEELPPLNRVLMSHGGAIIVLEITGEIVPMEIASRHYPWPPGRKTISSGPSGAGPAWQNSSRPGPRASLQSRRTIPAAGGRQPVKSFVWRGETPDRSSGLGKRENVGLRRCREGRMRKAHEDCDVQRQRNQQPAASPAALAA